jgi:hypothetical protein
MPRDRDPPLLPVLADQIRLLLDAASLFTHSFSCLMPGLFCRRLNIFQSFLCFFFEGCDTIWDIIFFTPIPLCYSFHSNAASYLQLHHSKK